MAQNNLNIRSIRLILLLIGITIIFDGFLSVLLQLEDNILFHIGRVVRIGLGIFIVGISIKIKTRVNSETFREILVLLGATGIVLIGLAFFIVIGELIGVINFQVGTAIFGLSPLDTWLVVILIVFFPAIFFSLYLLEKYKVFEL